MIKLLSFVYLNPDKMLLFCVEIIAIAPSVVALGRLKEDQFSTHVDL